MNWPRGPARTALRQSTEAALDQMKDEFVRLDAAERRNRQQVDWYVANAPDRVAHSGLAPRADVLDRQAVDLVSEYLDVLDRFPTPLPADDQSLYAALEVLRHLSERMRKVSESLDGFLLDYARELARAEQRSGETRELRRRAVQAAGDAVRAWEELCTDGYRTAASDRAVARARLALRKVGRWGPASGVPALQEQVIRTEAALEDLRTLAREAPARAARVGGRLLSLETRIAAIRTRLQRVDEDLGALRREFSVRNFRDLDASVAVADAALERSRELFDQVRSAAARPAWSEAWTSLAELERTLADAEHVVDGPRERLATLREFRADPAPHLARARFAIRDAQLMVTGNAPRTRGAYAQRLDAMSARLQALPQQLDGVHPDYWGVLTVLASLEAEVDRLVEEFRGRPT